MEITLEISRPDWKERSTADQHLRTAGSQTNWLHGSALRAPAHIRPPSLQQELRNRSLSLGGLIQQMCQKAQNHLQSSSRQMVKHLTEQRVRRLDHYRAPLWLSCYPYCTSWTHAFIPISVCPLPTSHRFLAYSLSTDGWMPLKLDSTPTTQHSESPAGLGGESNAPRSIQQVCSRTFLSPAAAAPACPDPASPC